MALERVWALIRGWGMTEETLDYHSGDDELACLIYALQDRCDELEARVSFLEDEANSSSMGLVPPKGELDTSPLDKGDWEGEIEEDEEYLASMAGNYKDALAAKKGREEVDGANAG